MISSPELGSCEVLENMSVDAADPDHKISKIGPDVSDDFRQTDRPHFIKILEDS